MRVLHAASFFNPSPGGFVPLIAALAERLRARGDAFAFVAPRVEGASWHDALRAAGAELHAVDGAGAAARLARAWRPDVAHVHFYGWEPALSAALWTARTRLFWHAHSLYGRGGAARPTLRSLAKYRLLGARVERFVTVSRAVGDELAALGAPRRRIVTVPNAVDAARFRPPSAAERAAARRELGLAEGEPALLFFGRDPLVKGADVLAAALPGLPGAAVVTVATPAEAGTALAASGNRVLARARTDDVRPLLWAADALAVPSRGEGFGLVLLEAALTGLPVVASDLPALREAAAGRAGVAFAPAGDAAGLGTALRAALAGGRLTPPAPDPADSPAGWAERIVELYERGPAG
ncbi:MAG: D-inositol-3-phosphate glycosyltransferase [Candidatus Eremiobacteraeota bacterium]|jgi:glycosyltransferase involved in cell wall biosynthesis|nr:D-inositol-3-phosphate glycosyltransferase [Candidatus Eremiobacteraeota bacterium]